MCRDGKSCARDWRRGASRDESSIASAMTRPVISRGWSNSASSYFCHPRKNPAEMPARRPEFGQINTFFVLEHFIIIRMRSRFAEDLLGPLRTLGPLGEIGGYFEPDSFLDAPGALLRAIRQEEDRIEGV